MVRAFFLLEASHISRCGRKPILFGMIVAILQSQRDGPKSAQGGAQRTTRNPGDTDSQSENPNRVALTFRAAPSGNAVKDSGSRFRSIRAFFREFCHSQFPTDPASVEA